MKPKEIQISALINMEDPQGVLDEVKTIVFMIFPEFDFESVDLGF